MNIKSRLWFNKDEKKDKSKKSQQKSPQTLLYYMSQNIHCATLIIDILSLFLFYIIKYNL